MPYIHQWQRDELERKTTPAWVQRLLPVGAAAFSEAGVGSAIEVDLPVSSPARGDPVTPSLGRYVNESAGDVRVFVEVTAGPMRCRRPWRAALD
jgi:hypothetical protein